MSADPGSPEWLRERRFRGRFRAWDGVGWHIYREDAIPLSDALAALETRDEKLRDLAKRTAWQLRNIPQTSERSDVELAREIETAWKIERKEK